MSNNDNTVEVNEDSDASVSSNYKHTKRRSEVFRRQSAVIRQLDDVSEDNNECSVSKNSETNKTESSEEFDLSKHIKSLEFEKEMWIKEYKQRKSQRRLLQKRETALGPNVDLDMNILSESEREFLSARPNYVQIRQEIEELRPIAIQIQQLNREINHRSNKLIERIEQKIQAATKRIAKHIDNSDIVV